MDAMQDLAPNAGYKPSLRPSVSPTPVVKLSAVLHVVVHVLDALRLHDRHSSGADASLKPLGALPTHITTTLQDLLH